ncbi:hypothetical protein Btru_027451 [Bulinus truncatus]|nr:hypothetical protein Btru_027451 [Bulinus truncatus]
MSECGLEWCNVQCCIAGCRSVDRPDIDDLFQPWLETSDRMIDWPKCPSKESVLPSNESVLPSKESVLPNKEIVLPSKESVLPSKESVLPSKESVLPSKESVLPSKESVLPSKESVLPSKESVLPSKESMLPSKESMLPSKESVLPSKESVLPSEESVLPSKESVLPSKKSVLPSKESVLPSKERQRNICLIKSINNKPKQGNLLIFVSRRFHFKFVSSIQDKKKFFFTMLQVYGAMTSLITFCLCCTLISSQSLSQFFWNMISQPHLDQYTKNFLKTSVAQEMFDIEMPPQTTPPPEGQFGKPGDTNIFGLPPPSSEMMFAPPSPTQTPNDFRPRLSDMMATWSENLQQPGNNVGQQQPGSYQGQQQPGSYQGQQQPGSYQGQQQPGSYQGQQQPGSNVGQQQSEQMTSTNQGNGQNYDSYNTGNFPSTRDFEPPQGRFAMAGSNPNMISLWQSNANTETFPMRPGQGMSPQANNFFIPSTNQASPPMSVPTSNQMMDTGSREPPNQDLTPRYYYSSANSPRNNFFQSNMSPNYPRETNSNPMQNNIPGNSLPSNPMQNNIPGNSLPSNPMQNNIPGNSLPSNPMQNNIPGNSFTGNQEIQPKNLQTFENYENVPQNTAGQRNVGMNSESYAPPANYHRNNPKPENFHTTPIPTISTPPPPNVMPDNGQMVSNFYRSPTEKNSPGPSSYQRNYQPPGMTTPGRNFPGVNMQENGSMVPRGASDSPPRINPPNYYMGPNNNWSSSNVPWISQQRGNSPGTLLQYNQPNQAPRYPNRFNSETYVPINGLQGSYPTQTPSPISPFSPVQLPLGQNLLGTQYRSAAIQRNQLQQQVPQ